MFQNIDLTVIATISQIIAVCFIVYLSVSSRNQKPSRNSFSRKVSKKKS